MATVPKIDTDLLIHAIDRFQTAMATLVLAIGLGDASDVRIAELRTDARDCLVAVRAAEDEAYGPILGGTD